MSSVELDVGKMVSKNKVSTFMSSIEKKGSYNHNFIKVLKRKYQYFKY